MSCRLAWRGFGVSGYRYCRSHASRCTDGTRRVSRDGARSMVRADSVCFRVAADRACSVSRHTVGLFRHYWVVFKLPITVVSTIVLVIYMGTFRLMAAMARFKCGPCRGAECLYGAPRRARHSVAARGH